MTIFSNRATFAGALLLGLTLIAAPLSSQNVDSGNPDDVQSTQNNAEGTVTAAAPDETTLIIGDSPTANAADGGGSSPSVFSLLRVVIILLLLCAAIWGIITFLRKSTGMNVADDPYLKSVANLPLGANKSAQVLTVGSRAFLVGVTEGHINLISELDDKELIDAMNLAADRNAATGTVGFQSVIASFLPGPRGKKGEQPHSDRVATLGADLIRRQRERLGAASTGEGEGEFPEGERR